jgi:hypothetical protein
MDTTNQLTSYIRRKTTSNTVSYSDANLLQDLNVRYKRACSAITGKVQDFFFTWWIAPTVLNQNEYTIEKFTFPDATTRDIVSIKTVSVKFKEDEEYTKLDKWDFNGLDYDFYNQYIQKIKSITADELMALANNYLVDLKETVVGQL